MMISLLLRAKSPALDQYDRKEEFMEEYKNKLD